MAIDPKHRFEADFAGEVHDITHKTEPIVFVYVRPVAVNECRLAAFVSARNCLSSHFNCPLIRLWCVGSRRGAAAAAEEEEKLNKHTITLRCEPGMLRLDCRSETKRF